jgi:Uma2 family endonuclease
MSTATPLSTHGDASVVLHDVSWDEYCNIVAGRGDRRFHHTYDNGMLEIMSPSSRHESRKKFLGRVVERLADALDIDFHALGNTTHRRKDLLRGLEPDECYYFASESRIRDRVDEIDLENDPPPDLVIEVDMTNSSLKRLPIFAALRVPEVWRFDGTRMHFLQLRDNGQYEAIDTSVVFPMLRTEFLTNLLTEVSSRSQARRVREFVDWVVGQ